MDEITRHPAIVWMGSADVVEEADGIRPTRVPPGTAYQLNLHTGFIAGTCSGIRLAFRTDATEIELVVKPLRVRVDDDPPTPACFDLVVDGETAGSEQTEAGGLVTVDTSGGDAMSFADHGLGTIGFAGLSPAMKSVEVWLPQTAQATVNRVAVTSGSAVEPPPRRPRWIHYGSSISHCGEADRPTNIWPAVAARTAGDNLELTNFGFGGECHIDQFVARYIRDHEAALISMKLGINTLTTLTERTFRSAVHGFLDTVRDGHPATPIVVCSLIYSPDRETQTAVLEGGEALSPLIQQYVGALTAVQVRSILEQIVADRTEQGDEHLHYLHGFELFGPDDVDDLPDRLHPNTAGYIKMGQRFAAKVLGDDGVFGRYRAGG